MRNLAGIDLQKLGIGLPKLAHWIAQAWPPKLAEVPLFALRTAETVAMAAIGIVSRVTPVHTVLRNCTRDEGGPFEVGNQVLISSHRKPAVVKSNGVNVAEKSKQDFGRYD